MTFDEVFAGRGRDIARLLIGYGVGFSVDLVGMETSGDGIEVTLSLDPVRGKSGRVTVLLKRVDGVATVELRDIDLGAEPDRVADILRELRERLNLWMAESDAVWFEVGDPSPTSNQTVSAPASETTSTTDGSTRRARHIVWSGEDQPDPQAKAVAVSWLADQLSEWPASQVEHATRVLGKLVDNALRTDEKVQVEVETTGDLLRVNVFDGQTVLDASADLPPLPGRVDRTDGPWMRSGVDLWRYRADGWQKAVWFELLRVDRTGGGTGSAGQALAESSAMDMPAPEGMAGRAGPTGVGDEPPSPDSIEALVGGRRPVDWAELTRDKQVVLLGESHSNVPVREHLIHRAQALRAAGVTHWGIEAPAHPALDALNADPGADFSAVRCGPYIESLYPETARAMAAQGIVVVPLDLPDGSPEDRDEHMFAEIERVIAENPGAKIAALLGSRHLANLREPTVGELVRQNGYTSVAITFDGGTEAGRSLAHAAREAGAAYETFAVDLGEFREAGGRYESSSTDATVHLPQSAGAGFTDSLGMSMPSASSIVLPTLSWDPAVDYSISDGFGSVIGGLAASLSSYGGIAGGVFGAVGVGAAAPDDTMAGVAREYLWRRLSAEPKSLDASGDGAVVRPATDAPVPHGDPGHANDCVPVAFQGLEALHGLGLVGWDALGVVGSAGVSGGRIARAWNHRPPGFDDRAAVAGELAGRGVGAAAVLFEVYDATRMGHAVLLVHKGGGRVVVREGEVETDFDQWVERPDARGARRPEPTGVWAVVVDENGDVVEGVGDPDSVLPFDRDFGRNPQQPEGTDEGRGPPERRPGNSDELTEQEVEVLHLRARGWSQKALAKNLGMSLSAIGWQDLVISWKLGAKNLTHAVATALHRGHIAFDSTPRKKDSELTALERELLTAVAGGYSYEEHSTSKPLPLPTVSKQASDLLWKLGAPDMAQALAMTPGEWQFDPGNSAEPADRALNAVERDILDLVAAGRTRAQIAHDLNLSPGAVKAHFRWIFLKLDVTTSAAAVVVRRAQVAPAVHDPGSADAAEKQQALRRDRAVDEERRMQYGRDIFWHIVRRLGVQRVFDRRRRSYSVPELSMRRCSTTPKHIVGRFRTDAV